MPDQESRSEPFILFELAGATYGLRSREVVHMEMIESVTPVPNAPPFVDGVVFSRGQVIPVINLRVRFGFERIAYDLRSRLIVTNAESRTVGFAVDTAREFMPISPEAILMPPEEISGLSGKYLEGIVRQGNRLILILDMEEVLKLADNISLPAGDDPLPRESTEPLESADD
jgi:purine-binding chemotaxis protein CheW